MNQDSSTRTYESAYVAFLDILGFKAIVLDRTHEQLEALYLKTLSGTIEHALSDGKYVLVSDGEAESLGPDIRKATVNSLLVSDSILIWTDDCRAESFVSIVTAVRSLLAFSMIDRILLRGAIAVGPLTMVLNQWPSQTHSYQHSLFGRSIVDAVEAEKLQDWVGCMITTNAIECYQAGCAGNDSLIEKKVLLRYRVPMKDGQEVDYHVIDWVNHAQAGIDFQSVTGAFGPSPRTSPAEFEKIKRKLANTLKFVKHVKPSAEKPPSLGQFPF